jgi:hypothetical protein
MNTTAKSLRIVFLHVLPLPMQRVEDARALAFVLPADNGENIR